MMRDERLTQGAPTPSVTHHSIFTVGSITVPGCRLLTLLALPLRSRGGRIGIGISVLCSRIHQNRPAPHTNSTYNMRWGSNTRVLSVT